MGPWWIARCTLFKAERGKRQIRIEINYQGHEKSKC